MAQQHHRRGCHRFATSEMPEFNLLLHSHKACPSDKTAALQFERQQSRLANICKLHCILLQNGPAWFRPQASLLSNMREIIAVPGKEAPTNPMNSRVTALLCSGSISVDQILVILLDSFIFFLIKQDGMVHLLIITSMDAFCFLALLA